jgi:hypothetical protein
VTLSLKDSKPDRRADVWLRQAGTENALIDPVTGAVHLLNETALAIWDLCDGQTLPIEMIAGICEATGLPEEVVTEDLERILAEFDRAGLIEWAD